MEVLLIVFIHFISFCIWVNIGIIVSSLDFDIGFEIKIGLFIEKIILGFRIRTW